MVRAAIILCCCSLFVFNTSSAYSQEKSKPKTEESKPKAEEKKDLVDEILAGHSYHGDAFNEGPRQKAYLMGGTGNVSFPVTTQSKLAQAFINQGIGQLHGFWELEAERSFRHAAALDDKCAMAFWGAALACVRNRERARGFIAKAVKLKDKVTKREQMYIDALNKYLKRSLEEKEKKSDTTDTKRKRSREYLKNLESIVMAFPNDLEAKAFVAHRIWQNAREGVPIASYLATDALLKDIYEKQPLHPAHHYSIHLWDYRKPENALRSAAHCGPAAPSIAHMWHMPGHIYSRLKRYEDAVYQQEASARVDHAHMIRDQVMPDEIFNFAHNNEWLIRNLVFIGRVHDAVSLAKNMIELPQHPRYNTLEKRSGSAAYGRRRLLQALREYELYEQSIALCQSPYLAINGNAVEANKTMRLLACSAVMKNDQRTVNRCVEKVKRQIAGREKLIERSQKQVDELQKKLKAANAKKQKTDDLKAELKEVKSKLSKAKRLKTQLEKTQQAIDGYRALVAKKYKDALAQLRKTGGEDACWMAEIEFLAAKDDAERKKALANLEKQVKRRNNQVLPLARQIFALYKAGKKSEAKAAFKKLRETSTSIDLDIPVFNRLEPIAVEFGYGKKWLGEPVIAADTGFRPKLDSLGPFRWTPPTAPEWALKDNGGKVYSSKDYRGRPYIMIFYLGGSCVHCAEQLAAFSPRLKDFQDTGIDIIAVSIDNTKGLIESVNDNSVEMKIPLIPNEDLSVFKKFRVYDDFEKLPLHGTFLIDGKGKVRWQDISYEPFMDHNFLLIESKRLLDQDKLNQSTILSKIKP